MIFTLFWMAYEAWQAQQDNTEMGQRLIRLLDAAEAAPKPLGSN